MKYPLVAAIALVVLVAAYLVYSATVVNPRVERELREDPAGERARKVMLITLPSGKTIPVNYLRDGQTVYAAADGRWWRELSGAGARVQVLVQGETLVGQARAIEDEPERRAQIFDRLRPTAPKIFGTLVQIDLVPPA
jgi:hypothetical protein